MKKILKYTLALCAAGSLLCGCLEETYPDSELITGSQLTGSQDELKSLFYGIPTVMTRSNSSTSLYMGYPAVMLSRESMGEDFPIYSNTYDYAAFFANCESLGNTVFNYDIWKIHYDAILAANNTLKSVNEESMDETGALYAGSAAAYRAMIYMDLTRLYEWKRTGTELDDDALHGLTVPLITQYTTEAESFDNPRLPFYRMYRFIMNDLNRAEEYLAVAQSRDSQNKVEASLPVVYGLKARMWLEMGSRFDRYPYDLQLQINHDADDDGYDALRITSARECYELAAAYARRAIDEGGYSPLTESQWYSGFNSATDNNSWMFALQIDKDDPAAEASYLSYTSQLAITDYGVSNFTYNAFRMIGKALFDTIESSDWRRLSWIAPADAGNTSAYTKYSTHLGMDRWATFPAYTALKYRPGNNEMTNDKTGNVVDIPLMRVEEMYLIEAEATGYTDGLDAGMSLLRSFVNTRFDDGSYNPPIRTLEAFVDEVMRQRRIEFWGEGVAQWDYKRLEKGVTRGYTDTNYPKSHRYNTPDGVVPFYMNVYISNLEHDYNKGCVSNPNPSTVRGQFFWGE